MTTPRLTPFPATIPCFGVFASFVIISDSDNEITTLPVRPAPLSPDRAPAWYDYPLNSSDDSSDKDLTMDRWRVASPSTCHPLPPSEIPSSSSPPSLLTSSSLPPPSLLPSSSHKRSRSPSPSLPSSVSPSSPPIVVPPPLEHIDSVGDNIEASF
ncbi:hypothetical protein Tco_0501850 [Tanacetum coccineum]